MSPGSALARRSWALTTAQLAATQAAAAASAVAVHPAAAVAVVQSPATARQQQWRHRYMQLALIRQVCLIDSTGQDRKWDQRPILALARQIQQAVLVALLT